MCPHALFSQAWSQMSYLITYTCSVEANLKDIYIYIFQQHAFKATLILLYIAATVL